MTATTTEAQTGTWSELWRLLLAPRADIFGEPENPPTNSDDDLDESAE
jgi:hypothetical protein